MVLNVFSMRYEKKSSTTCIKLFISQKISLSHSPQPAHAFSKMTY